MYNPKHPLLNVVFGQVNVDGLTGNLALFLLRIYAGITIAGAGLDKVPTPSWMTDQVVSMNFAAPEFFAWAACFSEFAFGIFLVFGLMTRLSAFMLAFTMGVAAFGFQNVSFMTGMHIAQHFFWMFILFMLMGGGKWSLDYFFNRRAARTTSTIYFVPFIILAAFLALSIYKESTAKPVIPTSEDAISIESINIAGSFNNWDPSSNSMEPVDAELYRLAIPIDQTGIIEFKFTANQNWDINLGELDQSTQGFPLEGTAEMDEGNNTNNIKAYIPKPGLYEFIFDKASFQYSLDSLGTK